MKQIMFHFTLLFMPALIMTKNIHGQWFPDFPKIPRNYSELKESVRLEGSINASTSLYTISNGNPIRPPFKFNIYGTPTLYINDIKIPMRISLDTYQNSFRQEFLKKLLFDIDAGFSAYTENMNDAPMTTSTFSMGKIASIFMTERSSTQFFSAFETGLKYKMTPLI